MGYVMLWLEQMAFCGLFTATAIAFVSHLRSPRRRYTLFAAAIVLPVLIWTVVAVVLSLAEAAKFGGPPISTGLTLPTWLLVGGALASGAILLVRGCRTAPDQRPRAAAWPAMWLLAATAVVLAAHVLTLWNLDLSVRQQTATLRAEASSLALANSPPRVVDRENAAFLYQQAFEGGVLTGEPKNEWLDGQGRPVAGLLDDEQFIAFVQHKMPLLKLVRAAASRPVCHFGRDWGRPSIDMLLPEIQNMRALARALVYEAYYRAGHDDVGGALENVLAVHRLAEHTGQEPILISLLVSFALDGMAKQCLEHVLQTQAVTAKDLAVLDGWEPTPNTPRLQRAFRLEEAFGLATFAQLAEDPGFAAKLFQGPDDHGVGQMGYRLFLLPRDVQSYRRLMAMWQKASLSTFVERDRAAKDFGTALKSGRHGPLTWLLLPALDKVHLAAARADAQQRLVQLAIALHRHRIEHGQFPESLDELTASHEAFIPLDPFSDQPLKLVRRDDRWVLYSIGPDLQDDRGTPFDDAKKSGDLTFELLAK